MALGWRYALELCPSEFFLSDQHQRLLIIGQQDASGTEVSFARLRTARHLVNRPVRVSLSNARGCEAYVMCNRTANNFDLLDRVGRNLVGGRATPTRCCIDAPYHSLAVTHALECTRPRFLIH